MLTAPAPPMGTVTFVFTDMEGSTRLWDQAPDAMNVVVARHDELLETVVVGHGGYVFARAGDGWGIAFGSSSSAVRAALEIQQRIASEQWPQPISDVRLRMGMHAGTANLRAGNYFGTAVNRAARVAAAADGGQVFLTDAVRALIADDLGPDWRLHDLGEHRLRDLTRAEHLWQIDTGEAAATVADLVPRSRPGNLPQPGAPVLGRDAEITRILSELRSSPVVTLVGVGGVGKTTLAVEVARTHVEVSGGAWFADLTTVEDPDEVASWIAATLGFAHRQQMSDMDGLVDALATDERFIVLDNAEHLIDRVAEVVDTVIGRVPSVRMLVTSREPLAIRGETVHRVPPLDTEGASTSPAVALFIERARIAAPDLTTADFPGDVVVRICEHLDGLPLAIELAAAHADIMTPDEILEALEADRLELRSGLRSASQRHQSVDDLVAWSYERLEPNVQRVFERLSLFVGGSTAEAAVAVCGDDAIDQAAVRSALRTLVRKSLVTIDRGSGQTRFTMLETIHRYAQRRCREEPSNVDAEERHAHWFADFSRNAAEEIVSPAETQWLRSAGREVENLERAARWAISAREFDVLGDIGEGLSAVIQAKPLPGVAGWIDLALDALPSDHAARLSYTQAAAFLTVFGGDLDGWSDLFDRATGDSAHRAVWALMREGFRLITAFFKGDVDTILADSPQMIERARGHLDARLVGSIAVDYGLALLYRGESDRAAEVAEQLLAEAEALGVPSGLAWAHYLLGELASETDPGTAIEHYEESVEYGLSVDAEFIVGISLIALAATAGRSGDNAAALDSIYRAIKLWHGLGNRPQFWTSMRNLVEILHRIGHDAEAYRVHLATEAAAGQAPELFGPYGELYRGRVREIVATLGEEDRAALEGEPRLDYANVARYALEILDQIGGLGERVSTGSRVWPRTRLPRD
jgi:predicted ATPase/class 3 adenylate cyclase